MFGRVTVNKAELKFREFDTYRSFYCGLCRSLKKHGFFTSLSLNYDMTFLNMLLSSLYEPAAHTANMRCMCHMCKKHCERQDIYTAYTSDMTILLSYYKCLDDFSDDKSIPAFLYSLYLKPKIKRIKGLYSEKCSSIENALSALSECEKTASFEECANLFGKITAVIFTPEDDIWRDILYNIGFYLGKFIYIADAYCDIESDIKKNRPNPLKNLYQTSDFNSECNILLNMMAAECASEFEKLPLEDNIEILRNILYSGIWQTIEGDKK